MLARIRNGSRYQTLNRLFSDGFENVGDGGSSALFGVQAFPAVNVWDEGDQFVAEAELPGLNMEDLEVFVCHDELTIKGERREAAQKETTYHRRERGVGTFHRVVQLPVAVESDKVAATLKNGILTIRLPKSPDVLPRKVEVAG